jgi:hypothetical protein
MHHHSSTWSDVLSILAILTSMFGIFMRHTLAQSRERAKAHADNVKLEARELLTALARLHAAVIPWGIQNLDSRSQLRMNRRRRRPKRRQ